MFCCLLLVPCHFILLFILPFYNRNINSKGSTIYVWLILSSHLFTSNAHFHSSIQNRTELFGCKYSDDNGTGILPSLHSGPGVHPCVRPSVTICFFNILKTHRWNFMKLYRHLDINGANMHMQN